MWFIEIDVCDSRNVKIWIYTALVPFFLLCWNQNQIMKSFRLWSVHQKSTWKFMWNLAVEFKSLSVHEKWVRRGIWILGYRTLKKKKHETTPNLWFAESRCERNIVTAMMRHSIHSVCVHCAVDNHLPNENHLVLVCWNEYTLAWYQFDGIVIFIGKLATIFRLNQYHFIKHLSNTYQANRKCPQNPSHEKEIGEQMP